MTRHLSLSACAFVSSALIATALTGTVFTQQPAGASRPGAGPAVASNWGSSGDLHTFHVQGSVHLIVGAGGNIALQVGPEGVLFVDTGMAQHAVKLLATVREKLSDKPIRWIVNTHADADHTGGNDVIGQAGSNTQGNPTPIVAHENVLVRMSQPPAGQTARATVAWPTSSYVTRTKDFFFNDEPVMLYHAGAAHTDGDSIVFFRRSDVIMAGDLYDTTTYPEIDLGAGGGVQGLIDGLNLILDLAVPKHEQEGGTFVIPGHGRVSDEADVLEYRDMVTIVRDRVADLVASKQSLEQVKASKPSLDYDRQYGLAPGATDRFVESVYRDLTRAASSGRRQ